MFGSAAGATRGRFVSGFDRVLILVFLTFGGLFFTRFSETDIPLREAITVFRVLGFAFRIPDEVVGGRFAAGFDCVLTVVGSTFFRVSTGCGERVPGK